MSKVDEVLAWVTEEDEAVLLKALRDPRVGHLALSQVLARHGHHVSESSIRRWRRANL